MPLPARGELLIYSSDSGHVIAQYNPLIIACFTRPVRSVELDALSELAELGLAEGVRGGLLYVVARKDMNGGIDPKVRSAFEKMVRQTAPQAGVSAVVILTEGFGGALLRGFLAGLVQLSSKRKALQIFGSVTEACRWLASQYELDAQELTRAFEGATAHLGHPMFSKTQPCRPPPRVSA